MIRPWPAVFILLLAGCGANEYYAGPAVTILPSHIQKIAVRPIVKKVDAPGHNTTGWEDLLHRRIEEELIRDGRFAYMTDAAASDGVLSAEITRIIFEPLAYDANNVPSEYKLWVVMDVAFDDVAHGERLWEEPRMEQEHFYFVSTLPGGLTDDEARDFLWDRFARDIVKRVVQGFGAVSGASEKKISSDPPPAPAPEAPKRPRTAPPSPY